MPKNRVIYVRIVVLVASALVWLGAELTRRIEWALPYTALLGVVLIALGVFQELWKNKKA